MKSEKNSCLLKFHSSMILPCQIFKERLLCLTDLALGGIYPSRRRACGHRIEVI